MKSKSRGIPRKNGTENKKNSENTAFRFSQNSAPSAEQKIGLQVDAEKTRTENGGHCVCRSLVGPPIFK